METLNERIKKLRLEKKITQSDLARLVDISDKAVSKWEVGDSSPDISLLPKLAKIFNVSIDYLLTGEKAESFPLEDLDDNKRLYYLIDKDDAINFEKYGYLDPFRSKNSIFGGGFVVAGIRDGVYAVKEDIIKYVFNKKAHNVFSKFCDKLLSLKYGGINHSFAVIKVLDDFIKFVIDIDRADVLKKLGVRYFKISNAKKDNFYAAVHDHLGITKMNPLGLVKTTDDCYGIKTCIDTFSINENTLRYFFEKKDKSPKCYKYISEIVFESGEENNKGFTRYQFLNEILRIGIEFNDFDFVKKSLDFINNQNKLGYEKLKEDKSYVGFNIELLNFVHNMAYGNYSIICRLEKISKEVINDLLIKGKYELACLAAKINNDLVSNADKLRLNISTKDIYVPKESEMQQIIKIADPNSKSDLRLLKVMNGRFLMIEELLKIDDDKFIYDCLKKYPTNSEELLNQYFKSNNIKGLYELMCDANLDPLPELLDGNLTDKVKDDIYDLIVKKGRFKEIDSKNEKHNKDELLKKYSSRLELNKFYSNEEGNLDKFMSKIKNKDYLSLSVELVSIMERKLTAFGYTGEDFHEKLTKYLDRKFPQDEDSYETPEICDLLQRLRIMRNSYLHPTINENVKPLTNNELTKCVKYILKEMEK